MAGDRYIVVAVPISSGEMYLDEAMERGYKPLALFLELGLETDRLIEHFADILKDRAEVLTMPNDPDLIAEKLSQYDIVAVVAGGEPGVRIADQIASRLGLKGNNPDTTYLRCNKEGMFEALKKAGIRTIESTIITTKDDITSFWKNNDLSKAVLKYCESGASVGVHVCLCLDDCYKALDEMIVGKDYLGRTGGDIIMQEYIEGIDCIVNTVSCDGRHKASEIWVDLKRPNSPIYCREKTIPYSPGMSKELVDYTLKVLDAVDFRYGVCHTELKYDSKGPILMETNPRPHGTGMKRGFLKEIFGNCMVDMGLDSLLDEEAFHNYPDVPEIRAVGMNCLLAFFEGGLSSLLPMKKLYERLPEFRGFTMGDPGIRERPKTIDLQTCPAIIRFVSDDSRIDEICDYAMTIDKDYSELHYRCRILDDCNLEYDPGTTALIYDDSGPHMSDGSDVVDPSVGVLLTRKGTMLEDRYEALFYLLDHVTKRGKVIVPEKEIEILPYGNKCLEIIAGLNRIEYEYTSGNDFVFLL